MLMFTALWLAVVLQLHTSRAIREEGNRHSNIFQDILQAVERNIAGTYKTCEKPEDALNDFFISCDTTTLDKANPLARGGFGQVYVIEPPGGANKLILKVPVPPQACHESTYNAQKCAEWGQKLAVVASHEQKLNTILNAKADAVGLAPHAVEYIAKLKDLFLVDVSTLNLPLWVLVFEYAGRALDTMNRAEFTGPDKVALTQKIMCQGLAGLSVFEEAGLIHADISPSNVALLDKGGKRQVKIFDFGAGGLYGSYQLGKYTPGFAPPETHLCPIGVYQERLGQLDATGHEHAYDIFQWGVVMVWLLTGNRITVENDMKDYASRQEAPSMDVIFGKANQRWRTNPKRRFISDTSCALAVLEDGAGNFTQFVHEDVFAMLDATVLNHGLEDDLLGQVKDLLLNSAGEGLLSSFPQKRPKAVHALELLPFCKAILS